MKNHKARSIIEVVVVFIFVLSILWTFRITPLAGLQQKYLHWNYFSHIVFILVSIVILLFARRSFGSYGFTLANWKYSLKWGLIFAAILGGVPILFGLCFGRLQINEKLRSYVLSTIIFQIFMSGFGEEILFRGYFQSRINEECGRPFRIWGFRFGIGLIIASLLFGFGHVLNPFNPLTGNFTLAWSAFLPTAAVGLFLGLVREKTGSILAPAIIHALPDTIWALLADTWSGALAIGIGVGWFISFALLFNVLGKSRTKE